MFERNDLLKFLAKIQGAEFKDDAPQSSKDTSHTPAPQSSDIMMFRDPEEYQTMSPEEKQRLTERMMGAHQKNLSVSKLGKKS